MEILEFAAIVFLLGIAGTIIGSLIGGFIGRHKKDDDIAW